MTVVRICKIFLIVTSYFESYYLVVPFLSAVFFSRVRFAKTDEETIRSLLILG